MDTGIILQYVPGARALAHPPSLFTVSRDVYEEGDGLDLLVDTGRLMEQEGKNEVAHAFRDLMLSLARAGAYLHGKGKYSLSTNIGLAHGDLYGHNVLIGDVEKQNGGRSSKVLLSDFGASSFYDKHDKEASLAIEGMEVRAWAILALENLMQIIFKPLFADPEMIYSTAEEFHTIIHSSYFLYASGMAELGELILDCWRPQNPSSRRRFDDIVNILENVM